MAKFGGQSSFGRESFGGDRYPTSPGYVISRMVAAMSSFVAPTKLKTCARLYGDVRKAETWEAVLTPGGIPAVLVHYAGATFKLDATSAARVEKTSLFDVYMFSGDYRDFKQRFEGKHANVDPALEIISGWCLYFMQRALGELKHFRNAQPVSERPFIAGKNAAGYVLRFTGLTSVDVYDDAIALQLESLGICHTPKDVNNLFESDNVTPNSEDGTNASPNVADLTE